MRGYCLEMQMSESCPLARTYPLTKVRTRVQCVYDFLWPKHEGGEKVPLSYVPVSKRTQNEKEGSTVKKGERKGAMEAIENAYLSYWATSPFPSSTKLKHLR